MTALDHLNDDHALLLQSVREAGDIARKFFDEGA